jgi:hypothetical protein
MPTAAWQWIGWIAFALALLWLLFAAWGDRSRGRRRCPTCWYDLASAGDPPLTCPECGREITALKHLHRPRRRRGHAIAALGLMLAGYASIATPRVQATGWRGAVPTTVLVVAGPWLPRAWHDEHFYITGEAGAQHEHLQAMLGKLNAELSRITQSRPSTLAEEIRIRWESEPAPVHRLANFIWAAQHTLLGFELHWRHGVEEGIHIARTVYFLREHSHSEGLLSAAHGQTVRRDQLARVSPRMGYLGAIDRIGIEASMQAVGLTTPEVAAIETRLLEGSAPEAVTMNRTELIAKRTIGASRPLGPIDLGAPFVTVEYTLRDADGAELCHHVVTYEFEIFDLPPGQPQPDVRNPMQWVMGNIWPVEVDGQPVRVLTRARKGAPIVYKDR